MTRYCEECGASDDGLIWIGEQARETGYRDELSLCARCLYAWNRDVPPTFDAERMAAESELAFSESLSDA